MVEVKDKKMKEKYNLKRLGNIVFKWCFKFVI